MIRSNTRTMASPSSGLPVCLPWVLHVVQHLLLTIGLIHLEPERLLQLPDLERAMRALAEQLDQPLVKLIDPLPELVDCHEYLRRLLASEHRILPFQPDQGSFPLRQ